MIERSVVIPVHGRHALTRACLDGLLRQRLERTELVVVDDGSDPATGELLDSYGDRVEVVRHALQGGFAAACNDGAAAAAGAEIVFLNNDTMPSPGWLDALAGHAREHPRTAIVGAKLVWPDNTVQHAGIVFDSERNGRHLYEGFPADHPAVNVSRPLQAVTGAAMLVRRAAFEELGGFDDEYVNGWEDVDLCLRAGELGYEVRYCADAVVLHLEGATRGREFAGDLPNYARWRQRWTERVRPDDLEHYMRDGLLSTHYDERGALALELSPLLGVAVSGDGVERQLAARTAKCLELQRENVRLAMSHEPAADAWHGVRARRAAGTSRSVSVVVPLGDHGAVDELVAGLGREAAGAAGAELVLAGESARVHDVVAAASERLDLRRAESDPAGGRAAALNRGIEAAGGEIVVLLADDFVPRAGWLAAHLAVHAADPRPSTVAIGPALFPERLRSGDPFRRWLEDSGALFGASFTSGGGEPPPDFWYGANTSLKRSFLLGGRLFDERLPLEAWDDHELGKRLLERGMEIVYAPAAAATHEHPLTFGERIAAMRNAGIAAATFDRLYPPPHPWATGTDPAEPLLDLRLRSTVARARRLISRREADLEPHWAASVRLAFLEGYRSQAPWEATRLAGAAAPAEVAAPAKASA